MAATPNTNRATLSKRGPLRFIVLARTGQDVGRCTACECCSIDETLLARFDLPVCEVLAAARQNHDTALANRTIWALAGVHPDEVYCPNGLDVIAIAQALCREARLRGLAMEESDQ